MGRRDAWHPAGGGCGRFQPQKSGGGAPCAAWVTASLGSPCDPSHRPRTKAPESGQSRWQGLARVTEDGACVASPAPPATGPTARGGGTLPTRCLLTSVIGLARAGGTATLRRRPLGPTLRPADSTGLPPDRPGQLPAHCLLLQEASLAQGPGEGETSVPSAQGG